MEHSSKEGSMLVGGDAVKEAKCRCESLKDRIEALTIHSSSSSSSSNCKRTLLRLIQSELSFLNRLSLHAQTPSSLSLNVGHLESIVHILQQPFITGVTRVCKTITLYSSTEFKCTADSSLKSIYVDIVCCVMGTPVWLFVSDRNPKYISWQGSSRNKGLKTRVKQILDAAQSSETLRPSLVILFFSNGLDDIVNEKLRDEFGAADLELEFSSLDCAFSDEPEGEWVHVFARSYLAARVLKIEINTSRSPTSVKECEVRLPEVSLPEDQIDAIMIMGESLCSLLSGMKCLQDDELRQLENFSDGHPQLINFDTTALIAIVSGISNGGINWLLSAPESKLRSRFKCNYEFVIAQVNSEILDPILKELTAAISGKGGIICQSVYSEFQELVAMCGGPKEKLRASYFLRHLRVVPDCPSSRMMNLPNTRKLAPKNKVVFGTGDHWHAPTLTANMAFVRAVSQTGMSLFILEHRPRALIGE